MPQPSVSAQKTVLLLGATGRTGGRVLTQLLDAGVRVRVIVRSTARLPVGAKDHANLTVLEADVLSLSDDDLLREVGGCDAVISCLGHVLSVKGVLGPPRDLVARATARLCSAIQALRPATPVRFILMSSVSVFRPGAADARRDARERAFLWVLCRILPPALDNQRAADFLCENVGKDNAYVQWVAVRPDTLLDGDVTAYALHEGLVSGLFKPASTNMSNVAHFMCALAQDAKLWEAWQGKLPVIINAEAGRR